jgi:Na+/H+ antiporter NhaB
LISIPIHLFGLFGVLKESFTITVTYTVVVTIFSLIYLFTNPFANWILLVIQIIFNVVMVLHCYLINKNKSEIRETIMRVDFV